MFVDNVGRPGYIISMFLKHFASEELSVTEKSGSAVGIEKELVFLLKGSDVQVGKILIHDHKIEELARYPSVLFNHECLIRDALSVGTIGRWFEPGLTSEILFEVNGAFRPFDFFTIMYEIDDFDITDDRNYSVLTMPRTFGVKTLFRVTGDVMNVKFYINTANYIPIATEDFMYDAELTRMMKIARREMSKHGYYRHARGNVLTMKKSMAFDICRTMHAVTGRTVFAGAVKEYVAHARPVIALAKSELWANIKREIKNNAMKKFGIRRISTSRAPEEPIMFDGITSKILIDVNMHAGGKGGVAGVLKKITGIKENKKNKYIAVIQNQETVGPERSITLMRNDKNATRVATITCQHGRKKVTVRVEAGTNKIEKQKQEIIHDINKYVQGKHAIHVKQNFAFETHGGKSVISQKLKLQKNNIRFNIKINAVKKTMQEEVVIKTIAIPDREILKKKSIQEIIAVARKTIAEIIIEHAGIEKEIACTIIEIG